MALLQKRGGQAVKEAVKEKENIKKNIKKNIKENILELRDISLCLDDFELNVSLDIKYGHRVTIIGPCGAGKTKLLEITAGLVRPDRGSIRMNSRDITCLPPEKRGMAFVYQKKILFPHLGVKENIIYGLKCRRLKKGQIEEKVKEVSGLLNIKHLLDRADISTLSGGETQKVALARALVTSPEVLILDEPMASLDPPARQEIRGILSRLNKVFGVTLIHVTHYFDQALEFSDRLVLLNRGAIEHQAGRDEFFKSPFTYFAASFLLFDNIAHIKNPRPGRVCFRAESLFIFSSGLSYDLNPGLSSNEIFLIKGVIKEVTINDRGIIILCLVHRVLSKKGVLHFEKPVMIKAKTAANMPAPGSLVSHGEPASGASMPGVPAFGVPAPGDNIDLGIVSSDFFVYAPPQKDGSGGKKANALDFFI
jgi:molybdate/tungstate transport system ATP-binding protein